MDCEITKHHENTAQFGKRIMVSHLQNTAYYCNNILTFPGNSYCEATFKNVSCIESSCLAKEYSFATLDQEGPIDFKVTLGSDKYIAVNNIILYTKCRVLYQQGNEAIPGEVPRP